MHIDGTTNYHNIFEPSYLQIESDDGQRIVFQPSHIDRSFYHQLSDIGNKDDMKVYKLSSGDGTIAFHYIIHPSIRAIIIPPNAIEMEYTKRSQGISENIQKFFETMAYKHRYRLIVGITPQSAGAFNQRVLKILRGIGYYMGPPSTKGQIYFGEHQSTYTGNGIPEVGTSPEYMKPPMIH